MNNRLNEILEEIRELEKSVQDEMKRRQEELRYKIRKGKVIFDEEFLQIQGKYSFPIVRYVLGARLTVLLTAPVIYAMFLPAVFMDFGISVYQMICFRVYGIPKVRRDVHFFFDQHYLKYLNSIEKMNCIFCSYFNGLASYISEIAARTEQYWCPIKHASGSSKRHSRYHHFVDYGDAEAYRLRLAEIRNKYDDLE
ncbi:MAG: hypothetical protein OEW04_02330 [Nitrospirota bacterium]|nr:hypothetical protein [Nitrospirota bacterium]